jgi:hypothetical protein
VSLLSRIVPEVKKNYPAIAYKLESVEKTGARLGKKVGVA